ncbi:MAG: hypothetical protein A2231_02400 [Candidatus Firestonebacteria bacterium RIFOXYA2_FULL_40_8]|nr:MAG: hypothetical protein A2231_02400 [Candidatus Firestonebacteria bacterium RIFOXYA2_FULL_40_8]
MLFVLFVLLIIALVQSKLFYKKILNPSLIFFIVWFVDFIFYQIDQSYYGYFTPISTRAQIIFIVSAIFFLIGTFTVKRTNGLINNVENVINDLQLNLLYKICKFIMPVFIISIIAKCVIFVKRYGNPFQSMILIRDEYVQGVFNFPFHLDFIINVCGYLLVLNLVIIYMLKKNKKILLFIVIAFLGVFINDFTVAGRGWTLVWFFMLIGVIFMTYNVVNIKFKLRHITVPTFLAAIFTVMIYIIFGLRSQKSDVSFYGMVVLNTFQYFVCNISSYGYFVSNPLPSGVFGYYTFGGLYKIFDDIINSIFSMHIYPTYDSYYYYANISDGPVNSSIHLSFFYADFGIAGVILISFLWGLLASYLFYKLIYRKRIIDIQLAAIAISTILFSVRGIYGEGRFFWMLILLVFIQHKYIKLYGKAK